MELDEERESIIILAPADVSARILEDVNEKYGLRSKARGILCSKRISTHWHLQKTSPYIITSLASPLQAYAGGGSHYIEKAIWGSANGDLLLRLQSLNI